MKFTFCLHKGATDFDRLKRNMNDGPIVFLTSLLIEVRLSGQLR